MGNTDKLYAIREKERLSHMDVYRSHDLYQEGSWLRKPVKTVMELLPCFADSPRIQVLDLGCGVGRNCIAIARQFLESHIDCIDILDVAIVKLQENAAEYGVSNCICGYVMPIEQYLIPRNHYDFVLAISALEHVDSLDTLICMLRQIRDGIHKNGIVCLIMNTSIHEFDKQTGRELPAQFEVNIASTYLLDLLHRTFSGWATIKCTVQSQQYDIPRGEIVAELHTQVVTFAARK